MNREEWIAEARRYAEHRYCFGDIVEDCEHRMNWYMDRDRSPYEFVDATGADFDLERADDPATWGPNAHKPFERKWK